MGEYQSGLKALFVDTVQTRAPSITLFHSVEYRKNVNIIQLNELNLFTLHRSRLNQEPFVTLLKPKEAAVAAGDFYGYWWAFNYAETALYSGTDPAIIKDTLLNLRTLPEFEPHASYFYLLGLTEELLGNESLAVEAYLTLWRDYPDSFYTLLARSKLEQAAP